MRDLCGAGARLLSTDSKTPFCSDQSKESMVAHAKTETAMAVFPRLACFMVFSPGLPHTQLSCERKGPCLALDQANAGCGG